MFAPHTGDGATAVVKELEHTADLALRIDAGSPADLVAGAVLGLARVIAGEKPARTLERRAVELEEEDAETALVSLLNAVIGAHEIDGFLPSRAQVTLSTPGGLVVVMWGETGVAAEVHVKAATFHELAIAETDGQWSAVVVFDV